MLFRSILFLFFTAIACTHEPAKLVAQPDPTSSMIPDETIDILCLGDSYTKGQSVPALQNFPNQLADSLRAWGWDVAPAAPRVVAQTGWRTDQLSNAIAAAESELADSVFSIVTLCIGVNNQYQNVDIAVYYADFTALLQTAIERAGGRADRVMVVSIPDWAYTPYGQNYSSNPMLISEKIDEYNDINRLISGNYGVRYIEVTDISRTGLERPAMVAGDGLHPSAEQYTEWVRRMIPEVREMMY